MISKHHAQPMILQPSFNHFKVLEILGEILLGELMMTIKTTHIFRGFKFLVVPTQSHYDGRSIVTCYFYKGTNNYFLKIK